MLELLLYALWWFLPAGVANVAPIIAAKVPGIKHLSVPIDGGLQWRDQPLLGPNKTWRGLAVGVLAGAATAYLQAQTPWWNFSLDPILFGALLGGGAIVGDALASLFKRQRGVGSGERWWPWDQLDYVLGGYVASLVLIVQPLPVYLVTGLLYVGLHILCCKIGFRAGLKARPY